MPEITKQAAVPGTVVGSGSLITPGGAQGPVGAAGPASNGFITKTTAYTLTTTDSGSYVICSGGSFALTLPAPVLGLIYQVRNDMGISGTVGTITIARTGAATIDGATSIALLPQQECILTSDGTNWRSYGLKREVILGTQDITSSTASGTVLLPLGYRYFELQFSGLVPVVSNSSLCGQMSINGGSTWLATGYYYDVVYNSTATAVASSSADNDTSMPLSPAIFNGLVYAAQAKVTIWPANASQAPTWISDSGSRNGNATPFQNKWLVYGLSPSGGPVNAFKYYMFSGNILNSFLTVKGVV